MVNPKASMVNPKWILVLEGNVSVMDSTSHVYSIECRDTKLGPISGCIITLSLHHIVSTLNGTTANKSLNG